MKIYAIFANDKIDGTTHKLFLQAVQSLKSQGNQVDVLNLYDREKELPFFRHDRKFMESHPFYIENKERFLQADALLFVFPLFWYSVPGILKTWLDLINGWAYKYESGPNAKPLHKIKQVLIIYSAMQKKENLEQNKQIAIDQQIKQTCTFIGIDNVSIYLVDQVSTITPEKLEQHLKKIDSFCKKFK